MIALQNISPKIDGCAGMIVKQSHRQYDRLPAAERRWQDPEDLMQEGLIAAVQAERNYRDNEGAKYSTFFYKKLNWRLDTRIAQPLRQMKRQAVAVIELDAVDVNGACKQIAGKEDARDLELEEMFNQLRRVLSSKAMLLLVSGLLCGTWTGVGKRPVDEMESLTAIKGICTAFHYSFEDLLELSHNEKMRKKMLTHLDNASINRLGYEIDARVLECLSCHELYYLSAIRRGTYIVDTMTCRSCYAMMQGAALEDSCFGKPKSESEGYSPNDVECRLHCIDREQCRSVVEKGVLVNGVDLSHKTRGADMSSKKSKKVVEEVDEDEYTGASDDYEADSSDSEEQEEAPVAAKKKKKKVVAAKPVSSEPEPKPKKTKKVKEADSEESEENLPWRAGSCMRAVFMKALEGAKEDELKKVATSAPFGSNWPFQKKILLRGFSGKDADHKIFTWKIDPEGGLLKPYDIKKVGSSSQKTTSAKA